MTGDPSIVETPGVSETNGVAAHDARVIFVTGASRSGTTLLARVLGNHSLVHASNELHYFGDVFDLDASPKTDERLIEMGATLMARELDGIWRANVDSGTRQRASKLVASLETEQRNGFDLFSLVLADICERSGKSIACDHTPRNIFYAAELLKRMPNARVVHMIRDPRAVLASQKHRWKRRWLDSVRIPLREALRNRVAFHPFTMTRLWSKATRQAMSLQDHPRFLAVRFEDLIARPHEVLEQVCAFLELPVEPALFDVQVMGSSHGSSRLREHKFDTATLERWRRSLRDDEIDACEERARDLMSTFDYTPVPDVRRSFVGSLRQNISYPLHLIATTLIDPRRVMIQLRAMMKNN